MPSKLKYIIPSILFSAMVAFADNVVVILHNGDRVTGAIVERSGETLVIESKTLGRLTIHLDDIASGAEPAVATPTSSDSPTPEAETASKNMLFDWMAWTKSWLPEGWSGEVRFGYSLIRTSDTDTGISIGLSAKREVGKHTFEAGGFYEYERNETAEGTVSKPTDKYGAGLNYEYDIHDPFFIGALADAKVDRVKRIDLQSDQSVLGGWRILNETDYGLDVAFGPGARYLETSSDSGNWSFMLTFKQDAFYRYNDVLRFAQLFSTTVDPYESHNYSYLFELSTTAMLTTWAHPRLIYRNSYDSEVGAGGAKREQTILLALTIPF